MGLRTLALAATVAALGVTASFASAAIGLTMKSSKNAALGATIVVSAGGKTLYHTNSEQRNTVKCTGACAESWPPLLIAAGKKPVAGPGVTAAKLGTVKRPDGKTQVTYGGYALYLYAGDSKAGEVGGQGAAGIWHAVATSGAIVTAAPAAPAAAGGSTNGYGSTSTGGGSATTTPVASGDY